MADWVVFTVAAITVVVGAIGVIVARNPVHSALMLVMTLFGIAVLYVLQEAHFLAAVQVIVYAGAIVVLFLFVIMLLGVDKSETIEVDPIRGQRFVAPLVGVSMALAVVFLGSAHWATGAHSVSGSAGVGEDNIVALSESVFTRHLLAFEATGILLLITVVAAIALARRPNHDPLVPVELEDSAQQEVSL